MEESQGGKLIIFSAPSGSGKTTIVKHLLKYPELNLAFSISATSREPREGEIDGVNYYYLSTKKFKEHIRNEDFLEWEEVYRDNFYGTLKSEVERLWSEGKNVIFDIDVAGGLRIKRKFPEQTLAVFVKPPSVDELKRRLKKRKTESEDKINMRIAKASVELATAPQFDTIIKNYDLHTAKQEAYDLVAQFIGITPVTENVEKKHSSGAGFMKKVGLYFGTFNPIHIGHLIIAGYMAEFSDLDEVWLVVTPHNPLKKKRTLLEDHHRYELVYRAVEAYPKLFPSKVEFGLPQPNYTVNTLAHLEEKYPDHRFSLIMGEDNLRTLHKWKNYDVILSRHHIYVYPRLYTVAEEGRFDAHPNIHRIEAPVMELSATFIRKAIAQGKDIRPMLPVPVWEYIDEMNFYR